MRHDLVFDPDLQIFFGPGPRGEDRILERRHLTGVSGGRPSAARPAPFLPWGSGRREATRPFWHPENVSGPQRPTKRSLIQQFRKLVRFHNADLLFTDASIKEIARIALDRGT